MKPFQFRRLLKWGVYSLLILCMALVVAHRPILRMAVDRAGRHFAEKGGYELEWQVSGSVISHLSVSGGRLTGSPNAKIKKLEWRNASIDYDLWGLLTKGLAEGSFRVALTDFNIEMDARPQTGAPKKKSSPALPDIWLESLDLQNINARIITNDGEMVLQGFSLLLDESKKGTVSIADFVLPGPGLHFTDVRGETELHEKNVKLTDLVLTPDVTVPLLTVGLKHLQAGSLPFELAVRSGRGTLESFGRVDDLMNGPSLDLTLAVRDLAHLEIARWVQLPNDLSWVIDSAEGQVKGALAEPRKLQAALILAASDMTAADMHFERLAGRVSMSNGSVNIESLDVQMNDHNRASITGAVGLDNRQQVNLAWSASIGDVDSIALPEAVTAAQVGVRKLVTNGTAQFDIADVKEGDFKKIIGEGTAEIDDLIWQQRRLEKASLEFRLADGLASISNLDLRFDELNQVKITGDVRLNERQNFNLRWQVDLLSMADIAPWFGVNDMPLPSAGVIKFSGSSRGAVADLSEKNFKGLQADGVGSVTGMVWQDARLDEATWDLTLLDSRVEVKELEFRLNERNALSVVGHAMLENAGEFDARVTGNFEQLADFSGWLALAKQPRITGGSASLSWTGGGKISEREITGSGSVNVSDLTLEGGTDVFALALETNHSGRRAEITKFQVRAGKFRAEASLEITETDLKIPQLVLFSGETRLVDGSVDLPLALTQVPRPAVPLDGARPLKVSLHIGKMKVQEIMASVGQKSPVTGYLAVDLDLQGTLSDLSGQFSATLSEAQAPKMNGKLVPALVKVDAALTERVLTVKASAQQKPLQTLTVNAELPLDAAKVMENPDSILDVPLTAEIVLPSSDVSVVKLFVPAVAAISGTASMDARLSGTLRKPEWEGSVLADATSATIKDSDIDIRDVNVRATFNGQRLVFDNVSTLVSGGEMRIAGSLDLTELTDPKADLNLVVKQALIYRNDTMSLRADGNLTCTGSLAQADVAGRVELVRGRVYKEIEFLPLSFPGQLPPGPAAVRVASTVPSAPPPFADWTLNVDLVTGEPIRLLGNVLNGRAVADLHLGGTGAVPILEGRISQQGARVKLPFSRLTLTRGDIIFTRDKPFDPQIDMQGDSMVENTLVTLYVTGRAMKPTVRFTSSPPLSEPEIATLLATGTTAGDAQAAGGVAANRAAFLLLSQTYRKLFKKRQTSRYEEDDEPGRTTFSFNPLSTQTSSSNISATYEISPNWQAEVGLGERGFRGMLNYLIRMR